MIRTQVYFKKQHLAFINEEAARKKSTMSEIIRRAVEEYTTKAQPRQKQISAGEFLLGLNLIAEERGYRGGKTLAKDIDGLLYGA